MADDDDAPGGVPPWMVTFSDCMTLLLCFFVMLLSFSSFEPASKQRLMSRIHSINFTSVFSDPRSALDSYLPPPPRFFDQAAKGSDRHTEQDPEETENPKRRDDILNSAAFQNRRTFTMPCGKLFLGSGHRLRDDAGTKLDLIAKYLQLIPACDITVAESRSRTPGPASEPQMLRSYSLMEALAERARRTEGSTAHRFSVSGTDPGTVGPDGQPVMVITLRNKRAAR